MKIGVLVFLLSFCTIAVLSGSQTLPCLWRLSLDGTPVLAEVVKLVPEEHNRFYYVYLIRGEKYVGAGHIPSTGLKIGDRVSIVYSRSNPECSRNDDVIAALRTDFILTLVGSVLSSFVLTGGALRLLNISLDDAFSQNVSIKKADILPWFQWRDTGSGDKR